MVPLQYLSEGDENYDENNEGNNEGNNDSMTAFRFNNGTLEELPLWNKTNLLCQANPLGVDW